MKRVRIGNGAGFWGDQLAAPRQLVDSGAVDYLTLEYLAELTMSILAHQVRRDPRAGYVTDFPIVLEDLLSGLKSRPELRIVTNAGRSAAMRAAASAPLVSPSTAQPESANRSANAADRSGSESITNMRTSGSVSVTGASRNERSRGGGMGINRWYSAWPLFNLLS